MQVSEGKTTRKGTDMKLNEIKRQISNDIILAHLADGWILDWDDACRGNEATEFFSKDGELRCLTVSEASGFGATLDQMTVRLFSIKSWWGRACSGFDWRRDDEEPVLGKTFWKADEDWYVADEAEAQAIYEKKRHRARMGRAPYRTTKSLDPSDALLGLLRERLGMPRLAAKHVRVAKETERLILGGERRKYRVEILNRVGNVKKSLTFQLGE